MYKYLLKRMNRIKNIMSSTNTILRHVDNKIKKLIESIKINLITNNISPTENFVQIDNVLIKNGQICTPEPGIFTNIYPQNQQLTTNSNATFDTLTVNNLIINNDEYEPPNPESKLLSSVSIFLNDRAYSFKVPFTCYISAISSKNKIPTLEINFEKIQFEKTRNIEYKLNKDDIIKLIGLDTLIILSFYEKKIENINDDNEYNNKELLNRINLLENEINILKEIIYELTGRN